MDANNFDALARMLTHPRSRRTMLGLSLGGSLSTLFGFFDVESKKRRKKKKKKKHKKKPCTPSCEGKVCGSNGCGDSCGPCEGGDCEDGQCVCSPGVQCGSGICCASGETCLGGECQECPPGPSLCEGTTLVCGVTPRGNPCACTTTVGSGTACIGGAVLLEPVYCAPCTTNADCETLLALPGQAVCVGGVDCDFFCGEGNTTACAVNGCVDVEFCDTNEDCSAGTCSHHRCQ